ncbi:MAG: hypothetical protein RLZZ618_681 [Pseudomonadota bacterium]|jgi:hypothetical protein
MQVDAIAVELRPRPMYEAADLGVRLVQAHARSVWATCTPVFIAVILIALSTVTIAPWLPSAIIFWLKPWLDRSVLFVLSRAAFGQSTRFTDLWHAQRTAWWQQLASTLTLRRFSPWRSFTQPAYQLEGQRGKAMRQRRTQLLLRQRGAATLTQFVFSSIEIVVSLGLMTTALWFAPESMRVDLARWFFSDGLFVAGLLASVYAVVVLLLEPFFVGAGFAMYLNRRVQLEAWDIEQEFRRAF